MGVEPGQSSTIYARTREPYILLVIDEWESLIERNAREVNFSCGVERACWAQKAIYQTRSLAAA